MSNKEEMDDLPQDIKELLERIAEELQPLKYQELYEAEYEKRTVALFNNSSLKYTP